MPRRRANTGTLSNPGSTIEILLKNHDFGTIIIYYYCYNYYFIIIGEGVSSVLRMEFRINAFNV